MACQHQTKEMVMFFLVSEECVLLKPAPVFFGDFLGKGWKFRSDASGVNYWGGAFGLVKDAEKIERSVSRIIREELGLEFDCRRIKDFGGFSVSDASGEKLIVVSIFKGFDWDRRVISGQIKTISFDWFERVKLPLDSIQPGHEEWLRHVLDDKPINGKMIIDRSRGEVLECDFGFRARRWA